MLVVQKFPEANTKEVTSGLESALDALAPGLGGIQIDTSIYRPATYIDASKSNVSTALLVGAVLALLASWRSCPLARRGESIVSILAASPPPASCSRLAAPR